MTQQADRSTADDIRASGLFDAEWYLTQYPDVEILGMDPVEHYLLYGAALGRNPSPGFDTTRYLESHPELLDGEVNPLVHHLSRRNVRAPAGEIRVVRDSDPALRQPVAVVIPVFNAPAETAQCIQSVLTHTPRHVRVIVIDDASPDGSVAAVLAELAVCPNVFVVRNDRNLGYTSTVNRGISLAGRADVVLLNSDTRVTPHWLRNLRLAAYSAPSVATATPFSDNAGAFSAPRANEPNPRPESLSDDDYARAVTRASGRDYPGVPTGSGYCMYVRRACLDDIGAFDADAFPRGYGEENDFCARATKAGWTHVIDDATLIYHVRSASFGGDRDALVREGRAIVDARHPDYASAVQAFLADEQVEQARRRVGEAATNDEPIRPRALFVISTTTGGTPQTNLDLMRAVEDDYETFLLVCDSKTVEFSLISRGEQHVVATRQLRSQILPFPHVSDEYDAFVRELLLRHSFELVHIRHIAWHSLNLPRICRELSIPVVFSFHDFYSICPTVKLLDEHLTYCGGVCTATTGECKPDLWRPADFPRLKHEGIYQWQAWMREMLSYCDAFVTTSNSARSQILSSFPELEHRSLTVIPHGRDLTFERLVSDQEEISTPVKIVIPGNLIVAKGLHLVEGLQAIDSERRFEFHVVGRTKLESKEGAVVHGAYERADLARILRQIEPTHGMVLSIWPETHCHTLTELWACGLPVIALDFGAIGERIREHGGGWLLPHGGVEGLYERLKTVCEDARGYGERVRAVWRWQEGPGRHQDTAAMAAEYTAVYRRLLGGRRSNGAEDPSSVEAFG